MSGYIHKSQIPVQSQASLAPEVRAAIGDAKNQVRAGIAHEAFRNDKDTQRGDGSPLPALSQGWRYVEFQVGAAHEHDPRPRGVRRLVVELDPSNRIREIYYTENHYAKFSFVKVVI